MIGVCGGEPEIVNVVTRTSARRAHGNCQLCGEWRNFLCRDRIVPGFKGGTYTPENIQWLCDNCHGAKSRKESSEAKLGRKQTEEHKQKLRSIRAARSDERWAEIGIKISKARRGSKQSQEQIERRRATRAAMSPERKAEWCRKLSEKLRGRVFSEEHRARISAKAKGRKSAPVASGVLRAAQLQRWRTISEQRRAEIGQAISAGLRRKQPEERSAAALKAWETRRRKPGVFDNNSIPAAE